MAVVVAEAQVLLAEHKLKLTAFWSYTSICSDWILVTKKNSIFRPKVL